MFADCSSLESLDLSKFNTSNVKDMNKMFAGCSSLKSLNLSNFDTSNVYNMDYMFNNCTKLESLDISNFNTLNVNEMNGIFTNCYSLKFINLLDYNGSDIFDTIPNYDNLTICIKDYDQINKGNNTLKKLNVKNDYNEDIPKTSIPPEASDASKNNFKIFIYPLIAFIIILLFILMI